MVLEAERRTGGFRSIVEVANLTVRFRGADAVSNVSLRVGAAEVLGLVGESGSGKTTVCRAIAGILPRHAAFAGRVCVNGISSTIVRRPTPEGPRVGFVFQSPDAALNPCLRIGVQLTEHLKRAGVDQDMRIERAHSMLRRMRFSDPERIIRGYPHELSGGQQQRVCIGIALLNEPDVLILDEPTTALDVTTQAAILDLLKEVLGQSATPVVYVSHDLRVIGQIASRIAVMSQGEIVETGATILVLTDPSHPYTRALIASQPQLEAGLSGTVAERPLPVGPPLLRVTGLTVHLGRHGDRQRILDDVTLEVARGQTLAVVGETGAGKTTLARAIMGLTSPDLGEIVLGGERFARSIKHRSRRQIAALQMVFQSATSSLNPRRTVGALVLRALRRLGRVERSARPTRMLRLLEEVQLSPHLVGRLPDQLSGGEKQRVAIARALAARPQFVVLDEAVSALDVSTQSAILSLLKRVQESEQVAYLFISHDLAVVAGFADEVAVLYGGRVVEKGPVSSVLRVPHHPYAEVLLRSLPGGVPLRREALKALEGGLNRQTSGCIFSGRCPWRIGDVCDDIPPPVHRLGTHEFLCHYDPGQLVELYEADRASVRSRPADGASIRE